MRALVADVGGSKTRLAMARPGAGGVVLEHVITVATPVGSLLQTLRGYWNDVGRPGLVAVAVGAAGRVLRSEGRTHVSLTNKALTIDRDELAAACAAPAGILIGDLAASAHALPLLGRAERVALGPDLPSGEDTRVVLGVGTGMGAAVLSREGVVLETEAGHMDLAAVSDDEQRWRERMAPQLRLSAEQVLSGNGVLRLAEAVSGRRHASCDALFAEARANDPAARAVIAAFSRWLGRTASNLVLATGAWGGVYLVGGVVQGLAGDLDVAAFRAGFEDKAPFAADLATVPVFRIAAAEPALIGLGGLALGLSGANARPL